MGGQELFERILGSLHEAVLDDSLWPATSSLIDEACASKGNFLALGDGVSRDDSGIFFARLCLRGQRREDLERWYFRDYYPWDERVARFRQLPDGRVVPGGSLYTEAEKKTSPVYNELLPSTHTQDGLIARLHGSHGRSVAVLVGDPVDAEGWSAARVEAVVHLLPHLRQYVRVRQVLVDARALGSSVAALLENVNCGVIQLDPRGRIVAANELARDLLRRGDGLADRRGLLSAASAEDAAALQALLARALPRFGGPGESGSMTVRRRAVSPRLVLHASPVGASGMDARPHRVAALVLVIDPAMRSVVDPGLVGAVLGLTPAESQIAALLARNRTIRDIAAATGRSDGTVRWHVKRILGKLGLSRQVELVQLVMSLSDVPQRRP
ncbi:MAG: helix-turn-helix transcriptional regulator [Defluviicoccus sp.]|nr:helix-turn-helix transcriptional regulator [Defluviicoccus sp.]MDE0387056.1 helix-turn-helix transcriptional regulator [Defluviicoccus sp.]